MKRLVLLGSVCASFALAACGGGGGSTSGAPPTITPTNPPKQNYAVSLHWAPAGAGTLQSALRLVQTRTVMDTADNTVIVETGDAGQGQTSGGVIDQDLGSPAIVTAQASPVPNPMPTAAFSTTSADVSIVATPSPQPNATALPSPAVGVVPTVTAASSSGTISVDLGGQTATDNLAVLRSYAIAVYTTTAAQSASNSLGEYGAYTVDSNCNLVGQTSPSAADVYITWANAPAPFNSTETEATLHVPGGGVALTHGYDPTTLTASDWSNTATAFPINDTYNAGYDTILFQAANGKIVYLGGPSNITPGNGSSANADIVAAVGCVN